MKMADSTCVCTAAGRRSSPRGQHLGQASSLAPNLVSVVTDSAACSVRPIGMRCDMDRCANCACAKRDEDDGTCTSFPPAAKVDATPGGLI